MARMPNTLFLYQIFIAFWMLILVSIGFFTAWTLINLQEPKGGRRPAFNLKEL